MTYLVKLFIKAYIPRTFNSNILSIFVLSIFTKREVATFLLVILKSIKLYLVLFWSSDNLLSFNNSLFVQFYIDKTFCISILLIRGQLIKASRKSGNIGEHYEIYLLTGIDKLINVCNI